MLLAGLQNELAHLWQPFWGGAASSSSSSPQLPRLDFPYIPNELGVAFRAANGSWRWMFASSAASPALPILLQVCHLPRLSLLPASPTGYIYERM